MTYPGTESNRQDITADLVASDHRTFHCVRYSSIWLLLRPSIDSMESQNLIENQASNSGNQTAIPLSLRNEVHRTFPFATLTLLAICISTYFLGILWSGESLSTKSWSDEVSPHVEEWWFLTVSPWPYCSDTRMELWRFITFPFVHGGIDHLLFNSICLSFYGSLVEVYYPSSHLAVVILFAMSSIGGALGFASLRPYSGLIGSSPGVYGLMGASAAMLCTYRSRIDPVVLFALPPTLVVHIVADIVLFLWSVGETAGDISHLFGTITGALAGLLFLQACTESSSKVPSIAWCAAIFLLLEMLSLIVIRAALWPPHANINPLDGRYDLRCCSGFLEWSQAAELHEDPDELGRCYKDIFYPYNSSSLS